jgi:hypothetical protein
MRNEKIIAVLEQAKHAAINCSLGVAVSCIEEALAELKSSPRWETPEQYEKRTGEAWPWGNAVYLRRNIFIGGHKDGKWRASTYSEARGEFWMKKIEPNCIIDIICATEAGPPPQDWRPEDGEEAPL